VSYFGTFGEARSESIGLMTASTNLSLQEGKKNRTKQSESHILMSKSPIHPFKL